MVKRTIITLLLGLIGSHGLLGQSNSLGKPLKVRAIYPAGTEVTTDDRITVEFNQNVVALGASMFVDDVVPIDIEPAVECEWNWVKLNTLQCDLPIDSDLDESTRYTVTVRPGIKAPDGQTTTEDHVHTFDTLLPAIRYTDLVSWMSPTQPIIMVRFNQDVSLKSMQNRVFLFDSVSGKEIPTKIWPRIWDVTNELENDYFGQRQTHKKHSNLHDLEESTTRTDRMVVLPQEPLSPSSKVSVLLLPGVAGAKGNLTLQERVLFDVEVTTYTDEFRILGLICQDVQGTDLFLAVGQSHEQTCKVRSHFSLVFSSRFSERNISDLVHIRTQNTSESVSATLGAFTLGEFEGYTYSFLGDFRSNSSYRVSVGSAETTYDESGQLTPVQDGFGRLLKGPREISFRTDRPLARTSVSQRNVVVDSGSAIDPIITLGNVDNTTIIYDILDEEGVLSNQTQHRPSPMQNDFIQDQFLQLRDSLRSPSGVMAGKVVARPRFEHPEDTIESRFFAQATPYAIYVKLGTVDTLAWVVDLQTGEPVVHADVEFYLGDPLSVAESQESVFSGVTDKDGFVVLPGYEEFDRDWDRAFDDMYWDCRDQTHCPMYFLRVEGEAGMALLPLDDDYELHGPYYLPPIDENLDHFATTSQHLYRPGDTVDIKGYVRTRRNGIRVIPDEGNFGLCVRGPHEFRAYEIAPIELNQFGAYHTSVKLTNRTEFGEYRISLVFDLERPVIDPCSYGVYESGGSFEVFEFKTNSVKVTQNLNATEFEYGDDLIITTQAKFHAGGPYAHENGQVVVRLKPENPPFESVSKYDYSISKNPSTYMYGAPVHDHLIELNSDGKNTTTIESFDNETYFGELQFESSVLDDRGKSVAVRTTATYFGVDQFVALRQPMFYDTRINRGNIPVGELWPIQVLVISKEDSIVSEKDVQIAVYVGQVDSNNKPPLFSSPSSDIVWEEVFSCNVVSAKEPASCDFTPTEETYYRIDAQIKDTNGNTQRSSLWLTAYLDDRPQNYFVESPEQVELELHCNSERVNVGDLIQCEVKNQINHTPMLVTIERTSVIDQWLVRLDPENPMFEFPILDSYVPHFELSVLAVAPLAIENPIGDTRYQVATEKFTLDDPRLHPLEINVSSNRDNYVPRDMVTLSISAHRGRAESLEYAVAVVDEAILDLNKTRDTFFDPTKKEWKRDDGGVRTYGLIGSLMENSELRSIEPTPYEDKTIKPYRSLSSSVMFMSAPKMTFESERTTDPNVRDVNRFVAYWNPSVSSSNGRIKLKFNLPDNLTRWKVLVMAVSADDRFGHASTSFSTTKYTEIRAVVPNVVTEGDSFQIGASILNRASRRRNLKVELQASGLLVQESNKTYRRQLEFQPNERKVVLWDVIAGALPHSLDPGHPLRTSDIQVIASAGDRREKDALAVRIPVRSNRVRVSSAVYGTLEAEKTKIPIGIPGKLANLNGLLDVTLTTNEAVNFDGVFRYAIEYPYSCWEQELTKAILAMQYVQLEQRRAKHGTQWRDPKGLIKRVLASAVDYQVSNGGMAYFTPKRHFDDPYLSAYTAIAFSWLEDAGYTVPQHVKRKLIEYLRKFINREEQVLTNGLYQRNEILLNHLEATVGAVVVHALAVSGELTEKELAHYSGHINQMDLFGLSQYLLASLTLDPTHSLNRQTFERIMNHRSLVDGAVEFVESVPRGFTQILHSDTRSLCSVLDALTSLSNSSSIGIDKGELHALSNAVRYARENLSHWRTTQDNVFCTNALIKYVDIIDSDIEDLVATVNLRSNQTDLSTRLAEGWRFNSQVARLHAQHTLQSQMFGSHGEIEIFRQGRGTAFFNVELSYLTTVDERINRYSGFEVHREYVAYRDKKWQILKPGDHIKKGEHVLVNLYLNNKFDRHHVMVDDTVPGGLEPVNMNLATEFIPPFDKYELQRILWTSELYQEFKEASSWGFHYRELGLQNVRFFANSITRRKYHLMWLGQAISAGEFTVLPTHVEEMYRPIMFGKSEPWTFKVKP